MPLDHDETVLGLLDPALTDGGLQDSLMHDNYIYFVAINAEGSSPLTQTHCKAFVTYAFAGLNID